MSETKKHNFLKVFLMIFILAFFSFSIFSVIYHNHGEIGYEDDGTNPLDKSTSIETYIIEGAGYFLNSYSDVLTLLNRIEIADTQRGLDYNELQGIVDRAFNNLNKTKSIYNQLIAAAENTPYNREVIEKLATFNYFLFMENNSLTPSIFKEVIMYLKNGDITGTFKKSVANFDNIISVLSSIKEDIDYGKIPKADNLWKVNQIYSGELLFGQYTAQVFYAL